jgi:hypothetical protein
MNTLLINWSISCPNTLCTSVIIEIKRYFSWSLLCLWILTMVLNSTITLWKVINFQVSSIPKKIFLSSRCCNYKSFNWRCEIFFNINNWKNQAYPSLTSLLQSHFYRRILETLHCQIPSLFHHFLFNWFPQWQGSIFYYEKPRTEQKAWRQRSWNHPIK